MFPRRYFVAGRAVQADDIRVRAGGRDELRVKRALRHPDVSEKRRRTGDVCLCRQVLHLRKTISRALELSVCLSRACLGK